MGSVVSEVWLRAVTHSFLFERKIRKRQTSPTYNFHIN